MSIFAPAVRRIRTSSIFSISAASDSAVLHSQKRWEGVDTAFTFAPAFN